MKYGYTIIYVSNVEETIQFYENAFGFASKFITAEKDYGELISGETTIAFASLALGDSNFKKGFEKINNNSKPLGVEMVFVTEQIEIDFKRALKAGAKEFEKIIAKPWGQKVGYVRDNNGFLMTLSRKVCKLKVS